jgi:hypothetical protein
MNRIEQYLKSEADYAQSSLQLPCFALASRESGCSMKSPKISREITGSILVRKQWIKKEKKSLEKFA